MKTGTVARMVLALLVAVGCGQTQSLQDDTEVHEQDYLEQFGYLPKTTPGIGHLMSASVMKDALKDLQRYAHIPATGQMDVATKQLMSKPRCGMPDRTPGRRSKRFVVGTPWDKSEVTWGLRRNTRLPRGIREDSIKADLKYALDLWSRNTPLSFREVNDDNADILISFKSREHAEAEQTFDYAFDGPGLVLAHAFYPGTGIGGDAHFDLDENWKTMRDQSAGTTSLASVAVHELGHSLGLQHSLDPKAIMYAYLVQGTTWTELPYDDMNGINRLYPNKRQNPVYPDAPRQPTRPPYQPQRPREPYQPQRPQEPYQPRPREPYQPQRPQEPYQPQRPREPYQPQRPRDPYQPQPPRRPYTTRAPYQPHEPTKEQYRPEKVPRFGTPDGQDSLDMCATSPDAIARIRGEVFVFSGDSMWRIRDEGSLENEAASSTSSSSFWNGLPVGAKVDAVYESPRGKIRFFVGRFYYEYTDARTPIAKRPLTELGLPRDLTKIDAATVWDGKTFLFADQGYWLLDEGSRDQPRVRSGRQPVAGQWGGVESGLEAVFQWPPRDKNPSTWFYRAGHVRRFDPGDDSAGPEQGLPFCSAASHVRGSIAVGAVVIILIYHLFRFS